MNLLHVNDRAGEYPPSYYAATRAPFAPCPALTGEVRADVCVVGAGYTGLSAALHLAEKGLSVVVLEAHRVGFGASGRNGGWLTGGFAWNHARYAETSTPEQVRALVSALNGSVDEVIREAEAQGIDADILRTDELMVATTPAQLARARAEVANRHRWGEDRVHMIGAEELATRVSIPDAMGAMVVKGVARIQPAKLVRGLAAAVERAGVTIAEGTEVTCIGAGLVETTRGTIRARTILRCTEGFTATLPGLKRDWLPMNSAQIVTAPCPPRHGRRSAGKVQKSLAISPMPIAIASAPAKGASPWAHGARLTSSDQGSTRMARPTPPPSPA